MRIIRTFCVVSSCIVRRTNETNSIPGVTDGVIGQLPGVCVSYDAATGNNDCEKLRS